MKKLSKQYLKFHNDMLVAPKPKLSVEEMRKVAVERAKSIDKKIPGVNYLERVLCGVNIMEVTPPNYCEDKVIMYIHGGAFIMGSSNERKNLIGKLALSLNSVVVSVDYRLAPENPFPAALDDCFAVYECLRNIYQEVCLIGESAGGNLTLALVHKAYDEDIKLPDKIAVISPSTYNDNNSGSHTERLLRDPMLGGKDSEGLNIDCYIGGADPRHKYISPLYGEFSYFPPTIITVGTEEMLYDDSILLSKKLEEAGVPFELIIGEGCMHVYPVFSDMFPEFLDDFNKIIEFLR